MRKFASMILVALAAVAIAASSALAASPTKHVAWNAQIRSSAVFTASTSGSSQANKLTQAVYKAVTNPLKLRVVAPLPPQLTRSASSSISTTPCNEQEPNFGPFKGRQFGIYFPENSDPFVIPGNSGVSPLNPWQYLNSVYAFVGITDNSVNIDGSSFAPTSDYKYDGGYGCWNIETFTYYDTPVCHGDPQDPDYYCEDGQYGVSYAQTQGISAANMKSLATLAKTVYQGFYFLGDPETQEYPSFAYWSTAGVTEHSK